MFHFSGSRVHNPMDSGYDDVAFPHQVTPFGYPRVLARLQLSEAFRSLLRPSSPVGTKAFTISPWVPLSNPGDSLLKFFRVDFLPERIRFVCLILVCVLYIFGNCIFPTKLLEYQSFLTDICNFATRMSICCLQAAIACGCYQEGLIRLVGLEPTTPRLSSACSNQLSYSRVDVEEKDRDAHRRLRCCGVDLRDSFVLSYSIERR